VTFEKFVESLFIDLKNIQEGKINPTLDMDQHLASIRDVINFLRSNCSYDLKCIGEWQLALGLAIGYFNAVNFGMENVQSIFKEIS